MVQHADIDHTGLTGVGVGDAIAHIADSADAHDASAISVLDTAANFTGTDVEAVLAELQDNIDGVGGGSGYIGYIRLEDQKAANTASGGFTTGAYRTRTLNTEVTDSNNDCSLSSDQITLAAGTYDCLITCPAVFVSSHKARLRNVTDTTTVLVGTSAYAPIVSASDGSQTESIIRGRFTIGASKALEVQHACTVTRATNGFGVQSNLTEIEVYCVAEFWRVS